MFKKMFAIALFLTFTVGVSYAAFEFDPTDIGVGARPLGMGKAFVGLADDGNAIFVNAAGMSGKDNFRFASMAGNLMEEIPYTVLGGSFKALEGDVGLGYIGITTTGIKGATLVGNTPEATGEEAIYSSRTFIIGYANTSSRFMFLQHVDLFTKINLRLGAALKVIQEGFSGSDDFDAAGSGYDIDLASKFDITEDLTGGLVIKNVIPGENIKWKGSGNDLPMSVIPGINWKAAWNLNVGVDGELIEAKGFYWHVGTEWWPIEYLAVRAGMDQKPSAGEISNNMSLGLGTRYEGFTFDYAYHTYEDVSDFTTHYFSIGFIGE